VAPKENDYFSKPWKETSDGSNLRVLTDSDVTRTHMHAQYVVTADIVCSQKPIISGIFVSDGSQAAIWRPSEIGWDPRVVMSI
jgi:hypothetical protein